MTFCAHCVYASDAVSQLVRTLSVGELFMFLKSCRMRVSVMQ